MSKADQFQNAVLASVAGGTDVSAALSFDPARYVADLAAFDLSEAQKQELLATLWSIMRSFVELGFRADVSSKLLSDAGLIPQTIPTNDELG